MDRIAKETETQIAQSRDHVARLQGIHESDFDKVDRAKKNVVNSNPDDAKSAVSEANSEKTRLLAQIEAILEHIAQVQQTQRVQDTRFQAYLKTVFDQPNALLHSVVNLNHILQSLQEYAINLQKHGDMGVLESSPSRTHFTPPKVKSRQIHAQPHFFDTSPPVSHSRVDLPPVRAAPFIKDTPVGRLRPKRLSHRYTYRVEQLERLGERLDTLIF